MFSSDATMLTDFGTAKGWPIYFMLGNLSKYIRSQPDSGAMHHLAYIPSVKWLFMVSSQFLNLCFSYSCQTLSANSLHVFIQNGEPRRIRFFLIAAGSLYMPSGREYLMRNSYMHSTTVSWLDVLMGSSVGFIHEFSLTLQITQRSKLRSHIWY